jgi:hypothetical protein
LIFAASGTRHDLTKQTEQLALPRGTWRVSARLWQVRRTRPAPRHAAVGIFTEEEKIMFVFAIETNGRTIAFTKEADRVMLDGALNELRDSCLTYMRDNIGPLWDGKAPITARLATASEELDYDITAAEYLEKEPDVRIDESILMYSLENTKGETVLMIPPTLRAA